MASNSHYSLPEEVKEHNQAESGQNKDLYMLIKPHSNSISESTDSGYNSGHSSLTMFNTGLPFHDRLKERFTNKNAEVGDSIVGKTFAGAMLSPDIGGNLVINTRNGPIHLHIPPGALPEPTPPEPAQLVYLRILQQSLYTRPTLEKSETFLTPTVECGPPGLTFLKRVCLTIPHCASGTLWRYKAHRNSHHYLEGERNARGKNWERMEDSEAFLSEVNGSFSFETKHFSDFVVTGSASKTDKQENQETDEGAVGGVDNNEQSEKSDEDGEENIRDVDKWMTPLVFMKPCEPEKYKVIVQLRNMNDVPTNMSSQSLCVKDTKENVSVTLSEQSIPNMAIHGTSRRDIPFRSLWSQYSKERRQRGPFVEFTVTVPCPNPVNFKPVFELAICQGKDKSKAVSMKVPVSREEDIQNEDDSDDLSDSFLSRQPCYDPTDETTLKFLSEKLYRKLCVILDNLNPCTGSWWKALAPLLGLKEVCMIQAVQDCADRQRKSPTSLILNIFFQNCGDHDVSETLKRLSNKLLEIENHDALDLIKKVIAQQEKPGKNLPPLMINSEKEIDDVLERKHLQKMMMTALKQKIKEY